MDQVTAVNAALVKAGCSRITTIDEDSTEAEVARAVYDERAGFVLSLHPWRFAVRQRQLSRSTTGTPPESRYDAAYLLPPCQRIIAVRINDCLVEFDRLGPTLLCDAQVTDLVVAELVEDLPVDHWPGYAAAVLIDELASIFALAIAEDENKAALMQRMAARSLTNAKTADSQGRTASKLPVSRFRRYVAGGTR